MSAFVYFFPVSGGHVLLDQHGLRDRFPMTPGVSIVDSTGPDGRGGCVFHAARSLPTGLKWSPAPGDPTPYWVGWQPDDPPTPGTLERGIRVVGTKVGLADGQLWLIPLVVGSDRRAADQRCGLPTEPLLAGGEIRQTVAERYRPLVERAAAMEELLRDWPARALETLDFCVDCLAVGYRVGVAEVLALHLLDEDFQAAIIAAAIDLFARASDEATKRRSDEGSDRESPIVNRQSSIEDRRDADQVLDVADGHVGDAPQSPTPNPQSPIER